MLAQRFALLSAFVALVGQAPLGATAAKRELGNPAAAARAHHNLVASELFSRAESNPVKHQPDPTSPTKYVMASGVPLLDEQKKAKAKTASSHSTRRRRQVAAKVNGAINEKQLNDHINKGLDELKARGAKAGAGKGSANSTNNADAATADASADSDLANLVNPFIGTAANSNPGNVCPGASTPFGMVKINIDVDSYAPAGYTDDTQGYIRGMSYLHDSGTGSSSGSYGNFESMPVVCPGNDFQKCPVLLDDRKRFRQPGLDAAHPGYFTLTLNNSIKMEATATRRSSLLRYTFPKEVLKGGLDPHIVQDWTNDLPGTFRGGQIDFDADKGQIKINGSWGSSFGSGLYTYKAFSCIDVLNGGKQKLAKTGLFQGDRFGQDTKLEGVGHANLTRNTIGGQPTQAGALFSFSDYPKSQDGGAEITLRVGVSFNSAEQACANSREEIGDKWDFEGIVNQTRSQWNHYLNRYQIDPDTDPTIAELVYSSLYYAYLTPNNATLEAGNLFKGAEDYAGNYYASLYCTWDTYRTFHPLLSLSSPVEMGEIVDNYIDGWRKNGWIPECRANNVPGLTQGGSHGVMVIADFLAKYHKDAKKLGVSIDDAYQAVFKDAYVTPAEWDSYGRQVGVYAKYGYIPFGVFDTTATGRQTRECSRTVEYAHNDFGARTVAKVAGHDDVAEALGKRSYNYKNTFDPTAEKFGIKNFVQQRRPDGSFVRTDPTTCSPIDNNQDHSCSLQQENVWGVYETSSFEYSLYAPHDPHGLIQLLAKGDADEFANRLDTFFDKGLFYAGNEPSFQTPVLYHYIDMPTKSVKRVRRVVYENFNTTSSGLPGNSDQGAMQTLLMFHLLGLYPVPATKEFLIVSPFLPSYTIRNEVLGNLHVTVQNFDAKTLQKVIPDGARAYVSKVLVDGKEQSSRCKIDIDTLFPGQAGKTREITLVMTADAKAANSCGSSDKDLPSSLSTGGFAEF